MAWSVIFSDMKYWVGSGWYKIIVMRNYKRSVKQTAKEKEAPEFIVMMGERKDNPGKSLTNAVEEVANQIWVSIIEPSKIKPKYVGWIECYPEARPWTIEEVIFWAHPSPGGGKQFSGPRWEETDISKLISNAVSLEIKRARGE